LIGARENVLRDHISAQLSMNKVAWRLFIFGFWKVIFKKLFLKYFYVYLLLEKLVNKKYFLVNEKYFLVKKKFILVFRKVFFFYFERKTLSGKCEKFRNIILFSDYIKFDPQTFD
jgi:hypothetical protein